MKKHVNHPARATVRGRLAVARRRQESLLIDCGNSRLKWARCPLPYRRGQRFAATGVIDLAALQRFDRRLLAVLRDSAAVTAVHVCNVAGASMARRIRVLAARASLPAPRFARSRLAQAGVRNAYPEPWRLGADRWVALIGARHEYPGASLCIVGMGSAMTIDVMDADGTHRGGCIVPGPGMMIDALLRQTAGIRRRAKLPDSAALRRALADAGRAAPPLIASDTRAALLGGAAHACAALIERAARKARVRRGPRLLLAGGGADLVAALLSIGHRRADELVLRGLAVLASHPRGERG